MKTSKQFQQFHATQVLAGQFTKDMQELNEHEKHYVFTYGTLRRGYERDFFPDDAYMGEYTTVGDRFQLLDCAYGNFPVAFDPARSSNGEGSPFYRARGKIHGELFIATTEELAAIDHIEANGFFYERLQTGVRSVESPCQLTTAWIYFGIPLQFKSQKLSYRNTVLTISNDRITTYKWEREAK